MTDQEINRKLAQAIGYKRRVVWHRDWRCVSVLFDGRWEKFDFMDWRVAGPVAQRYDCFPHLIDSEWFARCCDWLRISDTPQKAIALAVIAAWEAGVLE